MPEDRRYSESSATLLKACVKSVSPSGARLLHYPITVPRLRSASVSRLDDHIPWPLPLGTKATDKIAISSDLREARIDTLTTDVRSQDITTFGSGLLAWSRG